MKEEIKDWESQSVYERFESVYKSVPSYWSVEKIQRVKIKKLQGQKREK